MHYLECSAPITELVEDIQKYAVDKKIDYLICDSAAFACGGPPETAETATGYFSAVRDIGIPGSLHIAHTTKRTATKDVGQEKPFGSAFWHNSARATWMLSRTKSADRTRINGTLKARKNNLTQRGSDLAVMVSFDDEITVNLALAKNGKRHDQTQEQKVRAYLKKHPDASSNEVVDNVKGKRQELLTLVKKIKKA